MLDLSSGGLNDNQIILTLRAEDFGKVLLLLFTRKKYGRLSFIYFIFFIYFR